MYSEAQLSEIIDGLDIEPVRRTFGMFHQIEGEPKLSDPPCVRYLPQDQWHRMSVNHRWIEMHTHFPHLLDFDGPITVVYSVYVGTEQREGAMQLEFCLDAWFLNFEELEEAVLFCLTDEQAPVSMLLK